MKLKNKKTGEIGKILKQLSEDNQIEVITDNKLYVVKSLAELNEEWEDAQEEFWYLENDGDIDKTPYDGDDYDERMRAIGNYFETKEEAEKAVEKLKARKRLRDLGFKFKDWKTDVSLKNAGVVETTFNLWADLDPQTVADLDLLFNQEDD